MRKIWSVLLGGLSLIAMTGSLAHATDTLTAGAVGAITATSWPYAIGDEKGFFAAQGIKLDIIFAPTAPGILQQLIGGSLDIVATTGLAEPIHAVDRGSAVGILRLIGQVSPYALMVKPGITSIKGLKGKTIALGGLADITKIYSDRIMEANGLKSGDYDIIVIGATGARYAALQSGSIDATYLLPPFNFHAETAGFHSLALVIDYIKDLPFTGIEVEKGWAAKHKDVLGRFLTAFNQSVAWFYADANRQEAIAIMAKASGMSPADVTASYDFLRKIEFFEPTGKVSQSKLESLIAAQKSTGDIQKTIPVAQLIVPGLTELTN